MSMTNPPDVAAIANQYRRLAQRFAERVDAVPPDRWVAPSPCQGWSARDVLGHVIGTEADMVGRLGLTMAAGPSVGDDPTAAWRHTRDAVQRLLDDPQTANIEYDGVFGRSTMAEAFASFYSVDLVVHAWDIARAAGTDDTIPPEDLAIVQSFIDGLSMETQTMMRSPGAFGPAVEPPPDADAQTTLLCFLGRSV